MRCFSFSDRTAITYENGEMLVWTPSNGMGGKVFKNDKGSVILQSDNGYWWRHNKKEAEYCFYAEYWLGEFSYDSWAWAIKVCKTTGKVEVTVLKTEINPRNASRQDIWRDKCRSYIPQGQLM